MLGVLLLSLLLLLFFVGKNIIFLLELSPFYTRIYSNLLLMLTAIVNAHKIFYKKLCNSDVKVSKTMIP